MKKVISIICAVMLVMSLLAGCGQGSGTQQQGQTQEQQTTQQPEKTQEPAESGKPTEIVFWHSFTTAVGESLTKLVEQYNTTQDKVRVKAEFNGTYEEALNKFKASIQANALPDVFSSFDFGSSYLASSGVVLPAQTMAEKENFSFDELDQTILNYYKINNIVYSIPFNASTPLIYYNKTAFKEAGLDPENPPKTYDELAAAVQKLGKKDASGKIAQYGMAFTTYYWYFVEGIRSQGVFETDAENGRTGGKITKVIFNENNSVLNVLNAFKKVIDTGMVLNCLSKPSDAINAFTAGTAAITYGSSGSISSISKTVGDKFEVGAAFLPKITPDDKGGVCPGGGSLWMIDKKDDNIANASWDFVKFLSSAEVQSQWNADTGYLSVNKKAYELSPSKDVVSSNPMFKIAIDQLNASPGTPETYHPLIPVYPEITSFMQDQLDKMFQDNIAPEKVAKNMETEANRIIERYNATAK